MATPEQMVETQLRNIEKRTGKSLDELAGVVRASGLARHGEIVAMLKRDLGMGHGDANTLVHHVKRLESAGDAAPAAQGADALYTGPKAALRPIHDALLARISAFGAFETSPKKTYVSLRRRKQFATVGPATNTAVQVGLNLKGVAPTARLLAERPGSMCDLRVRVTDVSQVDDELVGWIRAAFDASA